jgi:hypothetical protein
MVECPDPLLPSPSFLLDRLRFLLWMLIAAEMVGVAAELLLISHWEDWWQWMPLVVLTLGLAVLVGHVTMRNRITLRAFRVVMWSFLMTGGLGLWLHYDGRAEFRLELDPSLTGWRLFSEAMTGSTTPPVLAPGIMIQIGCLGLASVYRLKAGAAPCDT